MKTKLLYLFIFISSLCVEAQTIFSHSLSSGNQAIPAGWTLTGSGVTFSYGDFTLNSPNSSGNFILRTSSFSLIANQNYNFSASTTEYLLDNAGNVTPNSILFFTLRKVNDNNNVPPYYDWTGMTSQPDPHGNYFVQDEKFHINTSGIYYLEISGDLTANTPQGSTQNAMIQTIEVKVDNSTDSNILKGKVSYDRGSNGCTSSNSFLNNVIVKTTDTNNNNVYYSSTSQGGDYIFYSSQTGITYQTAIDVSNNLNATPAMYSNAFTSNSGQVFQNQDFCVTSAITGDNVGVVLIPTSDARPGFNSKYKLEYVNRGNTTVNGNVTLNYDNTKFSSVTTTPTGTSGTNSLTWSYSNLLPFETRTIDVEFTINTPTQATNPVNGGDILNFTADITPFTTDVNQQDNTFNLAQTVVNSYDPNDAIILQGDFITQQQATQDLHFRIRFQNTGTASAININVKTMLDADLDWSTFQPLNASHTFNTSVNSTTGEINFNFPNIHLADSTSNEPASHGWLFFRAKPKNTFAVGDLVECKADIFFDYNAPIITNTATTQIGETMSVTNNNFTNDVSVYPNPVREILTIKFSNNLNLQKVELYNILGKLIKTTKENIIDLQSLKSGIYLLKIHTDKGQVVKKIVKE